MPDQREHNEDGSAKRPFNPRGGEDESSVASDDGDEHVHDHQQPITGAASQSADDVTKDDPHKVERLTKAGRDIDPNDGID